MLIIGHRGAAGLKPENTIASLRAAMEADADIIEFDIRLTKDAIPVLAHDFHTVRSHHKTSLISRSTLSELRKRTAGTEKPIVTLDEALKECFGKVMLNIELKHRGCGAAALSVLKKYIKKASDWDALLFSSFSINELRRTRRLAPKAHLALLHNNNPFTFVAFHRHLKLAAVGFHRLHINYLALEIAKRAGLFTYAYTVNRVGGAQQLAGRGIDGVVTDYPDRMRESLNDESMAE
jgi:glycerophosphoryl diester phosphodiesterase